MKIDTIKYLNKIMSCDLTERRIIKILDYNKSILDKTKKLSSKINYIELVNYIRDETLELIESVINEIRQYENFVNMLDNAVTIAIYEFRIDELKKYVNMLTSFYDRYFFDGYEKFYI